MRNDFTEMVIDVIASIPRGKVTSYGAIAAWAGNPRGARQVARILSACSRSEGLPWWRVVNKAGAISLPRGAGFERQYERLTAEGIAVDPKGRINLDAHEWVPNWEAE